MSKENIRLRGHHLIAIIMAMDQTPEEFIRNHEEIIWPSSDFVSLLSYLNRFEFRKLWDGIRDRINPDLTKSYDKETIQRFIDFDRDLITNPDTEFVVGSSGEPDSICELCCDYDGEKCALKSPSWIRLTHSYMTRQDEHSLKYLGLQEGQEMTINELFEIAHQHPYMKIYVTGFFRDRTRIHLLS